MNIFKFLYTGFKQINEGMAALSGNLKSCPKCDSKNIKIVKAKSFLTSAIRGRYFQELFNRSKDLYVCRDCSFSWEDR